MGTIRSVSIRGVHAGLDIFQIAEVVPEPNLRDLYNGGPGNWQLCHRVTSVILGYYSQTMEILKDKVCRCVHSR